MYANILMSTDGSDVARKGVQHGIALAKALNAKATIITVTEPLEVNYGGDLAVGWIPPQGEFDRFDAACKESAGKVLDQARAVADRDICRTFACSECVPSRCDYRNSKIQRLRLNRHGLSWASRPQEAIVGESNIASSSGRKRAGVSSVVADTNESGWCGETDSLGRGASPRKLVIELAGG
jgi:universal stress protein family protein